MRNAFFLKKEMAFVSEREQFTGLLPFLGMPHFNSSASLTPKYTNEGGSEEPLAKKRSL
jgi:hypothetical protein